MITRNFNLYLNAGHSVPLVINVNQYDSGEQWVFTLYNSDGTQYTPSTGAIVGIKSDGLGIINSGSVVDGKVVINETEQMTAAVGKAVFELLIDSQTHGTANFVVLVEPKPGNNADLSESDLSLLQEAIDATSPLPTGGSVGQVLTKTANGSAWSNAGTPTQEQVADAVSDWADEHITVTTGVVIDDSLSVAGAAADAKKTGDEITDLKSAINIGLDSKAINGTVFDWANEGIRGTDGYISSNSKRIRITNPIPNIIKKINTPSSCEYAIFAFTSPGAEYGTYIGWWTGATWSNGNIVWKKGETSFDNLRTQYNYYLFIVLKDSGNADITIPFASNLIVYNEFGLVFELSDKITESGNIFTDGSWEIGSITSATGDNYDSNINAIRTKTFYYLDGVTLSVANGWRGKWFKYQADGTYIGTNDWFKFGDRVLLEAGYYRIVLTETPTPQETTGTEWVNLFANGKFSQAVADITGEGMDCTVEGNKIDLSVQKFGVKQLYDIPWRTGVNASNQGIDSANGTLFILWNDGYVSLVTVNTGALIAAYEIESGHGNACQFSDEYYDASDDYPLLYCYDYDHHVYVNRVTTSGATLIKTYNIPIDGYRLSGGYDAVSKKLVTVHYKADSSTSGENNYCVLSVWDLLTVTENDGEYVPALVSEVKIPFIPVIQDCKYYKGLLYITSGYWSTYHYPLVIYAFDTAGNCITKVDDFPGFMIENDYAEAEGLSFYKDSGKYRMIFALHYVYELFMN